MESLTPLWLLDVDGVINAFLSELDEDERPVWRDFTMSRQCGFNITYSPTLLRRIYNLHTSGRVEVQWLTTWEHEANELLCPLFGWADLELGGRRAETQSYAHSDTQWWKFDVVRAIRAAQPERRIVWTDDELRVFDPARRTFGRDPNMFLLGPRGRHGITPAELDRIEKWLEEGDVSAVA